MPSLDELEAGVAALTVTYRNIAIAVEYHPDRVGMAMQRALANATEPPYQVGPVVDQLALVLRSWDLTRNGETVPITPDGIGSLPMGVSSAIGRAIMEDFNDPKSPIATDAASASSTPSPPISEPDASATAPTTPTSSYAPNGQGLTPQISPDSLIRVGT